MRDLVFAKQAARNRVVASRSTAADTHWDLWTSFCTQLSLDPFLQNISDPVDVLQVFLHRVRKGVIAPKVKSPPYQVRARSAEDTLRSIGQTFARMGAPDPRLAPSGKLDFRLSSQVSGYKKEDPPPDRVKPAPITLLQHVLFAAIASTAVSSLAIADMIVLAFFFLLRPGEYTATKSDTTPFRLCDVRLSVGSQYLDIFTATPEQLNTATFASLTFTDQKNGVRGEVIGMSTSGDPHFCPVKALVRRIIHLRSHNAAPTMPLGMYFDRNKWRPVSPTAITATLRAAVTFLGPSTLGFLPKDVTARCLRAAGAMALLCARVDTDVIRLIGRWRSDEMLRYLTVQAEPVMRDYSRRMLSHGDFVLHPNAEVPQSS